MDATALSAKDYKTEIKPVWCPGCGDYSILAALTKALADMGLPREKTALVSGIGCSSRLPAYVSVYGFHGVHGRALAAATGLKIARPDLTVLVAGGDGDGFSIGGNHFLHAARRNIDLTYIVMDNEVYGMTKGQASPTTDPDWCNSKLTPEGTGVQPVQPLHLALAAGANFIARGFAGNPPQLTRLLVEAVNHPGFSFVQVLSPCVTFRSDQRQWKQLVHGGPASPASVMSEAMQRLAEDDGFTTGILYRGDRSPFQPHHDASAELRDLEAKFAC